MDFYNLLNGMISKINKSIRTEPQTLADAEKTQVRNNINAASKKEVFKRNLLDNSDFTNPVNQRGITSTTNLGYFIDRWTIGLMDGNVTLHDGYISLTENSNQIWFTQYFEKTIPVGTWVTAAFCDINDEIRLVSTPIIEGGDGYYLGGGHFWIAPNQFVIIPGAGTTWNIKWVALYEGVYTIETLPEYQPKGYAVELAECQRYYRLFGDDGIVAYCYAPGYLTGYVFEAPMRIAPSIVSIGLLKFSDFSAATPGNASSHGTTSHGITYFSVPNAQVGEWYRITYLQLSSDLWD